MRRRKEKKSGIRAREKKNLNCDAGNNQQSKFQLQTKSSLESFIFYKWKHHPIFYSAEGRIAIAGVLGSCNPPSWSTASWFNDSSLFFFNFFFQQVKSKGKYFEPLNPREKLWQGLFLIKFPLQLSIFKQNLLLSLGN